MADDLVYANDEFFYSNVSSVTTNFNVNPYYDDFDHKNNYYKILFKPGFAVQSRELTQVQSILQDQIQKFGQHMFMEGSMVLGGKFTLDTRANYVKINDKDAFGEDVDINSFLGQTITGQTTGVKAYVNLVLDGTEGTDKPKTLYVTYTAGNANTDETVFTANEPLISNVGTIIVGNTIPVGYGSVFTVAEGVRFCKQHFIHHDTQTVVVDRYGINPTCKVGFVLNEEIVTSDKDSSLLDPALESSNYAAPGADRFKITPILTRLDLNSNAGFPDYVNLFTIDNGIVSEINERPQYNVIKNELARRTYDESGDYYVKGFNTVIEEHLDQGNGGYLASSKGGNFNLLSVQVEQGKAYVHGYEVNKIKTEFLTLPKATTYANVNNQTSTSKLGNYIQINEAVGSWNLNSGQLIDLYDTAQKRITTGGGSAASQTGKKIGTARVKSISSSTPPAGTVYSYLGSANGVLKVHLFDINMLGTNAFSSVKSVYYNNSTTADIGGDVILNSSNNAYIVDTYTPMLYYTGSNHTKTIRSPDGNIDTSFLFKKTSDVSVTSSGTFTLSSTIANETFPYGSGTLGDTDLKDIFLTLNDSASISLGTAIGGEGTKTLIGSGTSFNNLNPGDRITLSGNSSTYIIESVSNSTYLTTTTNLPATIASNTLTKVYLAGDMIDLTSKGVSGTRSVTTTDTSMTFDLNETLGATKSATVSYTMSRNLAREVRKVLKVDRYVVINCASSVNGTNGPYDLGFSDVYRVKSVRKDTNATFSSATQGTDVTKYFSFNNGQRDDCYTHAQLIAPAGYLTSNDRLLVCLDYFQPDYTLGVGYFSVDSYPVNDQNPSATEITTVGIPIYRSDTTGVTYDLKNFLDFRPVYTNTAADSTTPAGATTNPAVPTTLQYESAGLRLPADSETIRYDFSYYLARKDIVTLNKYGQFMIIQGVPNVNPITPSCPPHLMSVAKLTINPYPSLSPAFAKAIGRGDMACGSARTAQVRFTMKDIGVLKQRVDNIENYVSLSLLEKSAMDLKILDENGLDRFKNGIFVDSFTSFVTSDTSNPDHHICYDPKEGSIRPIYDTQAIGYELYSNTNIVRVSNLLMLPYVEALAVSQPYATTTRNVETTVYRFIGKLYLNPDSDYWVNDKRLASQTFSFGATDADVTPYSMVYGAYQTTVTGITTTDPVLISSVSSTSSVSGPGSSGGTNTVTYTGQEIRTALPSLISTYGASTPITVDPGFTYKFVTGLNNVLGWIDPAGSPHLPITKLPQTLGQLNDLINYNASQIPPLPAVNLSPRDTLTLQITGSTVSITATTTTTNTYQTVTSTSTQASRTFTETFQSLQTETQSIGDKVVAVAPIADIRPQTIAFEARGVKASTRHYVYFDGQLMNDYVTPARLADVIVMGAPDNGSNTVINSANYVKTGAEGDKLYSDENGKVYGFLRIPSDSSKSFRTGSKEVTVTDSPTDEPDATSSAVTFFNAQGITQTVQETIISTSHVVTETKTGVQVEPVVISNTTNTYSVTSTTVSQNTVPGPTTVTGKFVDKTSCMAYSFKLNTPSGEEGTFLSSVDVFFSEKDPNLGVWFEVRAMDAAGNITKTQVPDSEVWLESSQVNISGNGSVATNVKFKAPIFLLNNQEYAFIIHTVGINPNYYMYVSVLGQEDILTKRPVNDRPLTGTLYTTNNNTDWNIVDRVDLKINFYRAKFTSRTGEAVIGNQSREYVALPLTPATGANSAWFGERLLSDDELNLTTPVGGTISVGNFIIGQNSGANSVVRSIDGSRYKMTGGHYKVGESLSVYFANMTSKGVTSTIASKNTAEGTIYKAHPKSNATSTLHSNSIILTITESNGLFRANDVLFGQLSDNTVNVTAISKFVYSSVQFEPSYLDFIPTDCQFSMLTTGNNEIEGTDYLPIAISSPVDFDQEKAILSRSREISTFAGRQSNRVKINMTTTSDYVSPVVNIDRTYTVYIQNLINSNTAGEIASSGGGLKNKYISQIITLADGQDAEDLRIILTAYRPPTSNADFIVYTRISHGEDFESIRGRDWIEMEAFDTKSYSSLTNRKDWREFQFKFPDSYMTGRNDQDSPIVEYTNSANTLFQGFKQYQIKIGLKSDSSAIFPRVADLRVIALQK